MPVAFRHDTQARQDFGSISFSSGCLAMFPVTLWHADGQPFVLLAEDVVEFSQWLENEAAPVLVARSDVWKFGRSLIVVTDRGTEPTEPARLMLHLTSADTRLLPGGYLGRIVIFPDGDKEPEVLARGRIMVLSSPQVAEK